jgi:hypothetical protein
MLTPTGSHHQEHHPLASGCAGLGRSFLRGCHLVEQPAGRLEEAGITATCVVLLVAVQPGQHDELLQRGRERAGDHLVEVAVRAGRGSDLGELGVACQQVPGEVAASSSSAASRLTVRDPHAQLLQRLNQRVAGVWDLVQQGRRPGAGMRCRSRQQAVAWRSPAASRHQGLQPVITRHQCRIHTAHPRW